MLRVLLLLGLVIVMWGAPAAAHGICGKRANVIAKLKFRYGEVRQGAALANSIRPVELYAAGRNRSWTILSAHAPDLLCFEAAGRNWNGRLPKWQRKGKDV